MNLEQKFEEAKAVIQEWVDKKGHDRCWYYPDLFRKLANIFEVEYNDPKLPPIDEFKKGCEKYQQELYNELEDKTSKELVLVRAYFKKMQRFKK